MQAITLSNLRRHLRPWLTPAAAVLALAALLPPAATYASRYSFVQALQFVIFGVAAPALLIVGAGSGAWSSWPGRVAARLPGRAGRVGPASDAAAAGYAILRLLVFLAAVIVWRLPAATQALARHPLLTAIEMVTLLAPGLALWAELAGPHSARHQAGQLLRAALAALAMWTIWIIAYVTGMSSSQAARGMSAVSDQVGVGIMWAVPAVCFIPVIFVLAISWLGERDDADRELRQAFGQGSILPGLASPPRPPRGWRMPRS